MRWNYYKLRQLSLLQSAMDCYYKLRHLFYYKVRHGLLQSAMDLLQIATGITKCDDYYKLRQYSTQNAKRIKRFLRLHIVIKPLIKNRLDEFFITLKRNSFEISSQIWRLSKVRTGWPYR